MTRSRNALVARATIIVALSLLAGCSPGSSDSKSEKKLAKEERKREKEEKKEQKRENAAEEASAGQGVDQAVGASDLSKFASAGCDKSLLAHVYDPSRLQKLADCVEVSGKVEESAPDDDGDQHFLLKLDAGQESLINKKNLKKKNGDLVVEIVCANPITLAKAKPACSGYKNSIPLAAVGSHVTAIGTYVIDSHNGWAEVHPVSVLRIATR
jgi:hypothetical protein